MHTYDLYRYRWLELSTSATAFYTGVARKDWLKFYAERFAAVEVGGTFHRLHGHARTYASSHSAPELAHWAERIAQWVKQGREVHGYFDNDAGYAAFFNALTLQAMPNSIDH